MGQGQAELVVFSDDWGRHPSSCQHLVRALLPGYPTLWVNTIGTRAPGLSRDDLSKALTKLRQWVAPPRDVGGNAALPANLRVLSPRMWPGFRAGWQRRFNARRISAAVNRALAARPCAGAGAKPRRIALTTLPITADLIGKLAVDRWVYYCVDDFAAWPGLDGPVMREMEEALARRVDALVAVSEPLRQRLSAATGKAVTLLTHGIDLAHWSAGGAEVRPQTGGDATASRIVHRPDWWPARRRPIILFWGLVDPRLDRAWCEALVQALPLATAAAGGGVLALVGPQQAPDAALVALAGRDPRLILPGPAAYEDLPALAQAADVLVMPYADLPVTRAMQPLKLKEYLAAGYPDRLKPVVVRDLPATRPWADAADVVASAEQFVRVVLGRAATGVPAAQAAARRRLAEEAWATKAAALERVLVG